MTHQGLVADSLRLVRVSWLYFLHFLSVEIMYRLALIQKLASESISFAGITMFWLAAQKSGAAGLSIPTGALVGYFLASSLHYITQENELLGNLAADIRMGKLSASLIRPYPYLLMALARGLALSFIRYLIVGSIVFAIFFLVPVIRQDIVYEWSWSQFFLYLAVLALSLLIATLLKIVIGLLAFFMTQTWGPELLYSASVFALSGFSYPVHLAPSWLYDFIVWTPFYFMIGLPNLALVGLIDYNAVMDQALNATAVVAYLGLAALLIWRQGMGKFEAVGI
jgi:ABC-2 type transport system permease protein